MDPLQAFLLGLLVMGSAVIGLIFLRIWRKARDPIFWYFGVAFWLLGLNWLALAFSNADEPNTWLYAIRLVAFGCIFAGIWQKNRQTGSRNEHTNSRTL